jgi:hypothetical protein
LEAFAAGAVVVCSNTSSLPEVIADERFTFDPTNSKSIANSIYSLSTNESLREANLELGRKMCDAFSWDRATGEIRELINKFNLKTMINRETNELRDLVLVTPLPPAESGIADYSQELINHLKGRVSLTVISESRKIPSGYLKDLSEQGVNFVDIDNEKEIGELKGKFIYNFGNSHFHLKDLELFRKYPGFVILHDFFLSGLHWSFYKK